MSEELIASIERKLNGLSNSQIVAIAELVDAFSAPYLQRYINPTSDLITEEIFDCIGDTLKIHHRFSSEAFTKDKFEHALERAFLLCGCVSELAPRGNAGFDIIINEQKFALKTQADSNIKENRIHISKYMELGRGAWTDKLDDLRNLTNSFLEHLKKYERILTFRCLRRTPVHVYELVEIPKAV
jgi:hypothetical protein